MDELLFTPAALLDFLVQVDELKDKYISVSESDSDILISIDNATYKIVPTDVTDVEVSEDDIEDIDEASMETYSELENSGDITLSDSVTGGVIKELGKTLLVGGMVRLTTKLLK